MEKEKKTVVFEDLEIGNYNWIFLMSIHLTSPLGKGRGK